MAAGLFQAVEVKTGNGLLASLWSLVRMGAAVQLLVYREAEGFSKPAQHMRVTNVRMGTAEVAGSQASSLVTVIHHWNSRSSLPQRLLMKSSTARISAWLSFPLKAGIFEL